MQNNLPLVSVLMTAYNRETYIAQSIESVLASTYSNFELIIIDDSSQDTTSSIAYSYASKDDRIQVYVNEQNLGDYKNRNEAAAYATGKYIKYVDSDDVIMPWCLEIMVYCMECFPVASFGLTSNQSENIIYPNLLSSTDAYRAYYYKNHLLSVGPTASIIRRDHFENVGKFKEEKFIGDTELWLRLTRYSAVVQLPPGLVYWREHIGQQIVEERRNNQIELKRYQLNYYLLSNKMIPLPADECAFILQNLRNIKTRNAIKELLKGNVLTGLRKISQFKITFSDMINAMKRNRIYLNK